MKKKFTMTIKASFWFLMLFCTLQNLNAQVGIGTVTPAASSVLDITSTTQGMLTPRMTTTQKLAITSPANGLMVFDTTLKGLSYYDLPATSWVNITQGRNNFKRIKSTDVLSVVLAAELAAGGGTKYLLDSLTLYEINGTVTFNFPIDLNNAYVMGLDSSDDKLIKTSGYLFEGTKGGTIKTLTLSGNGTGSIFNLDGGVASQQSLIFRDLIIAGTVSVGIIQRFNMVFSTIVNYAFNTTGTIYRNITRLLLDNQGWFSTNTGIFEKYEGAFGSIQKQGGFLDVIGSSVGVDVSSNPTITQDGTMLGVNFTGSPSTGLYINRYTVGIYPGFSFNNKWNVECSGIPNEGDDYATGTLYLDRTITNPTYTMPSTSFAYKIPGTTIATNLFRASATTSNRLTYNGTIKRKFIVTSSISVEASGSGTTDFLFYFVKFTAAGAVTFDVSSETFVDSNSTYVQSFPISGTVELSPGDYVELYSQRLNGTNKTVTIRSFNMSMR